MGFFSLNATCALCGRDVGLNRFKIGRTYDGEIIWKCPECAFRGGLIAVDYKTGKASFIEDKDTETRKKCNNCGNVFCYSYSDIEKNQKLAKSASTDAVMGLGQAIGGTFLGAQIAGNSAESKLSQIRDFSKCPYCNSSDLTSISKAEWKQLKEKQKVVLTPADEIKKYKELLDSGAITQEEYDIKKKELLKTDK